MNGKNQAHMMTLLYNAFPSLKGGFQELVNMYRELESTQEKVGQLFIEKEDADDLMKQYQAAARIARQKYSDARDEAAVLTADIAEAKRVIAKKMADAIVFKNGDFPILSEEEINLEKYREGFDLDFPNDTLEGLAEEKRMSRELFLRSKECIFDTSEGGE